MTYIISYMRVYVKPSLTYADFIYVSQVWFVFSQFLESISLALKQGQSLIGGIIPFAAGICARKIGLRPTYIFGCTIFRLWISSPKVYSHLLIFISSGGFLATYLTIDVGIWAIVLSIAVCSGVGISLVYANIVTTTMKVR